MKNFKATIHPTPIEDTSPSCTFFREILCPSSLLIEGTYILNLDEHQPPHRQIEPARLSCYLYIYKHNTTDLDIQ